MRKKELANRPQCGQSPVAVKLTLTPKNYASIERALSREIGSKIIRQEPGYPAVRGEIVRVKKALCFVPDAGGFRNRSAAVHGAPGTTFEIEAEIIRHNAIAMASADEKTPPKETTL